MFRNETRAMTVSNLVHGQEIKVLAEFLDDDPSTPQTARVRYQGEQLALGSLNKVGQDFVDVNGSSFTIGATIDGQSSGDQVKVRLEKERLSNLVVLSPRLNTNGSVTYGYYVKGDTKIRYRGYVEVELYYAVGPNKGDIREKVEGRTLEARPGDPIEFTVTADWFKNNPPQPGRTHLVAVIDRENLAAEYNETDADNVKAIRLPNLVAVAPVINADGSVTAQGRVENAPVMAEDLGVQLWYSRSERWEDRIGDDPATGAGPIGRQVIDLTKNGTTTLQVPASALVAPPEGAKFLLTRVDRNDIARESNESDNTAATPLPDLRILNTQFLANGTLVARIDRSDIPLPSGTQSRLEAYWATGKDPATRFGRPFYSSGLNGLRQQRFDISVSTIRRPPAGATHIVLFVDGNQRLVEANENNNTAVVSVRAQLGGSLAAYAAPPSAGVRFPLTLTDRRVAAEQKLTTGLGVRINRDSDNGTGRVDALVGGAGKAVAGENDLAQLDLRIRAPGSPGYEYQVRSTNPNIRLWADAQKANRLEAGTGWQPLDEQGLRASGWVEWAGADHGEGIVELVVRHRATREEQVIDRVRVHTVTQAVILFTGETAWGGQPQRTDMARIARTLVQRGFDVVLFEPSDLRSASSAALKDFANKFQAHRITEFALIGHSHGGGAIYQLSEILNRQFPMERVNGQYRLAFTAYLDAIQNSSGLATAAETRYPLNSHRHVNYFQQTLATVLTGGPVGYPAEDIDPNTWPGVSVDHESIDGNPTVQADLIGKLVQALTGTTARARAVFDSLLQNRYAGEEEEAEADPRPAPAADLAVAATTPDRVTLTWADRASDERAYVVSVSADGGARWVYAGEVAANATSVSIGRLTPGTRYRVRVQAVNANGVSTPTEVEVVTPSLAPPAPANLRAVNITPRAVELRWTDVRGEERYEVQVSTDGGRNWRLQENVPADRTDRVTLTVATGQSYQFRVVAVNRFGRSAPSNTITVSTPDEPRVAPGVPSSLRVENVTARTAEVRWQAPSGAVTSYWVAVSRDGLNFTPVGDTGAGQTSFSLTGLTAGTRYWVRVRAGNGTGYSDFSNVVEVVTRGEAPSAPGNLRVANVWARTVDLNWDDRSGNETEFRIAVSRDGGSTWDNVGVVGANATSFRVQNLLPGTRYLFRVWAGNGTGHSDFSNVVDLRTMRS
jgi:hypothetical protein